MSVLGPFVVPDRSKDANDQFIDGSLSHPFTKVKSEGKEVFYPLGSDRLGRDVLSRLVLGSRITLIVGGLSLLVSLTIGIWIGTLSGYFSRQLDALLSWFMNVVWSIPTFLLVMAMSIALGKGLWQVCLAIGCTTWVDIARLVRGQVIQLKELEYIQSTKALGYRFPRILFKHLIPNLIGPLMVMASANFASAILLESGLSFLGVGIQPPSPSWGSMLAENYGLLFSGYPFLALLPGCAIAITVMSFNFFGNGLRDAFDVKMTIN